MARHKTGAIELNVFYTASWTVGLTLTSTTNDLTVEWGDGSSIETIAQGVQKNHTYATSGTKKIYIYTTSTTITSFSSTTATKLTSIVFNKNFSGNLTATSQDITNIKFKGDTNTVNNLNMLLTKLTVLDLSNVKVTGDFTVRDCNLLTSIIFKNTTNSLAQIQAYNCNLSTLDFSYVTLNSAYIQVYNNPNLSSIIFKNAANVISQNFWAYGCKLQDGLNSQYINWSNNVVIQLQNNNMTAAGVNLSLYSRNLDSATGGSFNISGTNAAPDSASGGYDGLAAKTALIAKSVTVTTN